MNKIRNLEVIVEGIEQRVQPEPLKAGDDWSNTKPEVVDDFHLKKSINLLACTALMVAVTGHSSIFISTSSIISVAGSVGAALICWFIGGLINLGLALCFAELATMIPEAGGPYAYVLKTFGPLPGFLLLWGYVVLIVGPFWAFLAYTAALYIIKPFFPDCHNDGMEIAVKLLAAWIMITLVALNCVYMKGVMKVQGFLSGAKILALLIIIVGGFYNLAIGERDNFEDLFESTSHEPGNLALAMFYSIFSYGGWQVIATLIEEMTNPSRDAPLSINVTFLIVISNYVLANVAYFTLLSPKALMKSEAVALLFIQRLYSPLVVVIVLLVAATTVGALNASILGQSRLLFAGARYGQTPFFLGMIHVDYFTPGPAIVVSMAWSLAVLFSSSLTSMMDYIALCSTLIAIGVILCVFYLRYTEPNRPRPYKTMWIVPSVELVINIIVLIMAVYRKPDSMGLGLGVFFAGIPIYWVAIVWKSKPAGYNELVGSDPLHPENLPSGEYTVNTPGTTLGNQRDSQTNSAAITSTGF